MKRLSIVKLHYVVVVCRWSQLVEAAMRVGATGRSRAAFYSRSLVSYVTAHHVIRVGGWRNLCDDPRWSGHGTRSSVSS